MLKGSIYILSITIILQLGACSSAPQQIYYWKDYTPTVYKYLKNDDYSTKDQLNKMEKYFINADNKHMMVAPGSHAHMGLLLLQSGQTEAAFQQFELEEKLFPESSTFMDFLMKNKNNLGRKK